MLDICISSYWQLEATEEFKLEVGLLRLTQVLHRECLGKGQEKLCRGQWPGSAPSAVA